MGKNAQLQQRAAGRVTRGVINVSDGDRLIGSGVFSCLDGFPFHALFGILFLFQLLKSSLELVIQYGPVFAERLGIGIGNRVFLTGKIVLVDAHISSMAIEVDETENAVCLYDRVRFLPVLI